jgi:hypothetical protein
MLFRHPHALGSLIVIIISELYDVHWSVRAIYLYILATTQLMI